MYNDVVAPECLLSRNIRENFVINFVKLLRLLEWLKIKRDKRNIHIDYLKMICYIFFTI